ncbi:MAG: T9SS type A sorting domain-containing protein [Flavobacteriaceae bacterium]|jgi:hypothetical protein|nr:T9SS type A sorting domain-containing protein [Flavobacteriaceae bacterium]
MKNGLYYSSLLILLNGLSSFYSQDIQWQRSLGGLQGDYLFDALPTPDYGFILAGSSVSEESGNKISGSSGNPDYFLWKMDEQGHEEWQKSFGGDGLDFLYSINLTTDGGYILGGSSSSGISGIKKDSCRGQDDYWILKLNAAGNPEWQKTFGGVGSDKLLSIQQTSDFGYIVGGSSDSPQSEDKTQDTKGSLDFWILKLDKNGNILWQTSLGGEYYDLLRSIKQTQDGGYILAGYSNSLKTGDKSEDNIGEGDYWLVKLSKDGNLLWDKTLGGNKDDELTDMILAKDGGYLLVGSSNSDEGGIKTKPNGEGSDIWIIKTDEYGNIDWQQTVDVDQVDTAAKVIQNKRDSNYLIAGSTLTINEQGESLSDYIAIRLDEKGNLLWKKKIGGDRRDLLQSAAETREGNLILAGTSNSGRKADKTVETHGQTDFWVVKISGDERPDYQEERKWVEVYPNPTERFVNVIIQEELRGQEQIQVYDLSGKLLQQNPVKYRTTPIDLTGYAPGVYVFSITLPTGKTQTVKIIKNGNE